MFTATSLVVSAAVVWVSSKLIERGKRQLGSVLLILAATQFGFSFLCLF